MLSSAYCSCSENAGGVDSCKSGHAEVLVAVGLHLKSQVGPPLAGIDLACIPPQLHLHIIGFPPGISRPFLATLGLRITKAGS